jgi:hypothetical protein
MAEQLKSVRGNLKRIIPEHIISENNYNFLEMLDAYYKWCESHGQWLNETKQLIDNYNYELIANDKLFVYKDVFLRLFPIDNPDMIRSLVKFSKVFYEHRGNLESYKFLFKLLWNEDIEIEYPTDWILRSSDGIWTANQYLLVSYNDNLGVMAGLVMFAVGSIAVVVPTPNGAGPWHFAVITMMMLYGVGKEDAGIFALLVHGIQTFLLILLGIYGLAALPFTNKTKKL